MSEPAAPAPTALSTYFLLGMSLSLLYIKTTGGIIYEVKEGEDIEEAINALREAARGDRESTDSAQEDGSDKMDRS